MSSAEALADLADRGELDIHGGKSGKNRTKQEAVSFILKFSCFYH